MMGMMGMMMVVVFGIGGRNRMRTVSRTRMVWLGRIRRGTSRDLKFWNFG